MADDQITAAQAEQSTPSVEGSEVSSEVQSPVQTQDQEVETQPGATSENQDGAEEKSSDGESGDQSGQEAKPNRFERRINKLIEKVKENGQPQSLNPQIEPTKQGYFSDEELSTGTIEPDTITKIVQAEVQKGITLDRIQQQYNAEVTAHESDLNSVGDLDPDLEAQAVEQYEALNYQINPLTGQKEFVPAVKFSEIVSKISSIAEKQAQKLAEKLVVERQQYAHEVSSSQAVPSSGSVSGTSTVAPDTTDFSQFEKAFSSKP